MGCLFWEAIRGQATNRRTGRAKSLAKKFSGRSSLSEVHWESSQWEPKIAKPYIANLKLSGPDGDQPETRNANRAHSKKKTRTMTSWEIRWVATIIDYRSLINGE